MAYQAQSAKNPYIATTGVALVHIVGAYLLVFGLAPPPFIVQPPAPPVDARNIEVEIELPPPDTPPEEVTSQTPTESNILTPPPETVIPRQAPDILSERWTQDRDIPTDIAFTSIPTVDPLPRLPDPVRPQPIGNPGDWANTSNYPGISIRRREEGISRFTVTVGTNGRVSDCRITSPSGYDRLDQAACRAISRNARFTPAKNEYGEVVPGTYSNAVNWRLPE